MTYLAGAHRLKTGVTSDESLPYTSYVDRGATPYTSRSRAGQPISLTEYASPTNSNSEVKVRPDLSIFAQDQWALRRVTLNLGIRYEYHRTKADPVTTFAGPLVDSHTLPGLDCIPCWHDIDPRFGVVWDVFGNGKTAIKGQLGRYVGLVSWVMSKTFNPQSAIVTNTSRSWGDIERRSRSRLRSAEPERQRRVRPDGEQELRPAGLQHDAGSELDPGVGQAAVQLGVVGQAWITS